jgi:hypothetical protein
MLVINCFSRVYCIIKQIFKETFMATVRFIYVHSLITIPCFLFNFLERIWGLPRNWDELVFVLFIKMTCMVYITWVVLKSNTNYHYSQILCSVAGSIAILLRNIAMLVALANFYVQLQLLGVLTICLELCPNVRCQAFDWLVLY